MKNKGFTLVELIAIIVIIAIIALIAVPTVLNIIDKSKEKANLNSAKMILEAGDIYYSNNMIKKNEEIGIDKNIYSNLETKGNKPENGEFYLLENGKTAMAVQMDDKCYLKEFNGELEVKDDINNCKVTKPTIIFTITVDNWQDSVEAKIDVENYTSNDNLTYEIYQKSQSDSDYKKVKSGEVNSDPIGITGLASCQSYNFKVIVYDDGAKIGNDDGEAVQCFVAGTKVYTEDGYLNIEDIKVGDKVYALDLETNEQELKTVKRTIINETSELYHLKIGDKTISTTPRHEFYIVDKGWVRAFNLEVGDQVITEEGTKTISEIEFENLKTPVKVYNLEVEGLHNYLITEYSILVHNAGSPSAC